MNIITDLKLNKLLEKANNKKLKLKKIYYHDDYFNLAINYLKSQNYLKLETILKIFNINKNPNYPVGYLVTNEDNLPIGFMGTVFSERGVLKKNYLFCNIHSWIIDTEYRLYAYLPIINLISEKINLTAFTPVPSLRGLLEKFGLKKNFVFYRAIFNFSLIKNSNQKFVIVKDKEIISKIIKENKDIYSSLDEKIYNKFLILDNETNLYTLVIGTFLKKKSLKFFNIFFVSNKYFFKKNWKIFKNLIINELKVNFFSEYYFENEESLFPENLLLSKIVKKSIYYRSDVPLTSLELLKSDLILS